MNNIRNFWFGTLRGRLTLSVALVFAVTMTIFIADLTIRQRALILDHQEEEAIALSRTLAVSSDEWLASFDIAGLQELVDAQRHYPELLFAMITDDEGHVMAHTDMSYTGDFVRDLPLVKQLTVISKTTDLVDVAMPVILGGKQVGWVRIGLGQKASMLKLKAVTRDGILYALIAILIGSLIAWMMSRRITRRLYAVQDTMNRISSGNRSARSQLSGTDEAAVLAKEFNAMLDSLDQSEGRFKKLFSQAAIPMSLMDHSGNILDSNQSFVQTFGYTMENMPTVQDWFRLAYPNQDYREEVMTQWQSEVQRATSTNTNITPGEYKVTCKNGEVRTMIISGTTIGEDLLATFFDITERKRMEDDLRIGKARLNMALESNRIGVWDLNLEDHSAFRTLLHDQIFGYETLLPAWTFEMFLEHIVPEDREEVHRKFIEATSTNSEWNFECRIRRVDGELRWILASGSQSYSSDVSPRMMSGLVQDISEKKLAEIKARNSHEKLEATLDAIPDLLFEVGIDGRINDYHSNRNDLLAAPPDLFLGQTFQDILPAEAAMVCIDAIQEIAQDGWTNGHQYQLDLSTGKHWFELSGSTVPQSEDHEKRFILLARDITGRKQAEEALRESEERFRSLYENSTIGLYRTTPGGQVILANPTLVKILGYPSFDELAAVNLEEAGFHHSYTRKQYIDYIEKEKVVKGLETAWTRKDGKIVYLSESARVVVDANGKTRYYDGSVEDITERKLAEQALLESELKFQTLAQISPVGIFRTNASGDTTYVNPKWCQISGLPADEALGNGWLQAVHPDDREKLINTWTASVQVKNASSAEYRFLRPDGSVAWVVGSTAQEKNSKGEIVGYIGTITDITGRKKAEEQLQLSEEKFRNVFENSVVGKSLTQFDGTLNANKALCNMLGYSKTELSTLKWEQITYPDDIEKTQNEIDSLFSGAKPSTRFEKRFIHKNGNIIWTDMNSSIQYDNNNQPLYLMTSIIDITERKKAEELLQLSESKFRMAFVTNPDCAAFTRLDDGTFVLINQGFTNLLGYTAEEVIGKKSSELRFWEIPEERLRLHEDLRNNGIVLNLEVVLRAKNGDLKNVLMSASIIILDGVEHILSITRDITDRKTTELELHAAMERAKESDRLKSAFLANMSHEIRTPMNGILGFAELLKDPELTFDQQGHYIEIIERSGARMLNIINDIVDISKIEAGEMKVSVSQTNVNVQIEFIANFFQPEIESKGLQIKVNNLLAKNKSSLITDREKLYAILTNLVKNAIKFTKTGFIEIGCGLVETPGRASLQPTSYLEFYIKDTGIGIHPDQQEFIFDRFRQGSETFNKKYEGAGLGLAISKAYVEMLGGKILVESEPGVGSTFRFTLPYHPVANENTAEIEAKAAIGENPLRKLKILIAEDDELSGMLLEELLKLYGKEILKVDNGLDAVEFCRRNPDVDLVLMDVQLPEMNGYEATLEIRKFNAKVIIIAQTAFALTGDREKALEAGCTDYISKPISIDELIYLLHKYFTK